VIGKLYSQCGIKKKKMNINRAPVRKTQRISEFENKVVKLYREVQDVRENNHHLVFIDESVFTSRGYV